MKTRHSRNSQCFARGRTNVQLQDVFTHLELEELQKVFVVGAVRFY